VLFPSKVNFGKVCVLVSRPLLNERVCNHVQVFLLNKQLSLIFGPGSDT